MAETVVCLVIEKLVFFLAEEVKFQGTGSLRGQIKDIKDELESMSSFLREADARADQELAGTGIDVWVKQVREVAYRMEDVMDRYALRVAQRHGHGFFKNFAFLLKKSRWRRVVADEIQQIKTSLIEIKERKDRYSFTSSNSVTKSTYDHSWSDTRLASHFISAAEAVGIEDVKLELIGLLQDDPTKRKVISVVGMGGLGKTTLVKIVSDSKIVKNHFECFAWVTVSQSYKKEELLRNLLQKLSHSEEPNSHPETSSEVSLISKLREYLQGKRYVVVFDDVWKVNFWDDIEHALPNDNIGSRIVITTRNKEVANFCKKSSYVHVHELQPLPLHLAWELFCKKAFQFEFGGRCPDTLKNLSIDIVGRCGGLPLAVVAIAGLLSTKDKTVSEWRKWHERLHSELESNLHLSSITKILSLSYHDLPYHLKSCFLYFGIFPEDYSVAASRLVHEWIAEGFIEAKKGTTLEQVANEYLTELIQRNMIQMSWSRGGANKFCKVHDLMRETILSITGKLMFCQVLDSKDSSLDHETRRLSVYNNLSSAILHVKRSLPVRSLFIFDMDNLETSYVDKLFECSKLLKVLDFEDAPIHYLPESVGTLLHLRYLSLRNTKIAKLPKTIGKLLNLQTLNVQQTLLQELPFEIYRLHKLRHLLCGNDNYNIDYSLHTRSGVRIHTRIGDLQDLQTLCGVDIRNGDGLVDGLMKLKQLRELRIDGTPESLRALTIEKLSRLEFLDVKSTNESEFLNLESISNPPPFLWNLTLRGQLEKLPHWIPQLQNAVTIRLFFSRLIDDPLKSLRALPNLMHLELYETYSGEELHIREGEFMQLKVLHLKSLERLSTLTIENGAMPLLEELVIGPSPDMKEVPDGIFHLRSLKILKIRDMPRTFVLRVQPGYGEDYWKVEHIRDVVCSYRIKGIRFETFKVGSSDLVERLQIPLIKSS